MGGLPEEGPEVDPLIEASPIVALVAIVRVTDQAVLAQRFDTATTEEESKAFEGALMKVVERAVELPAQPGWQDKITVSSGEGDPNESSDAEAPSCNCICAMADAQALCIVAVGLRGQHFPERVVQELLEGLIKKIGAYEPADRLVKAVPGRLSRKTRRMMKEVIKSYRDPEQVHKVMQLHQRFDKFKGFMQDNVKSILESHLAVETLQSQGQSISASADIFISQSICKRRKGEGQKSSLKAKLLVGTSVCGVAGLLAMHLAVQ